jgi:hypothetical protein
MTKRSFKPVTSVAAFLALTIVMGSTAYAGHRDYGSVLGQILGAVAEGVADSVAEAQPAQRVAFHDGLSDYELPQVIDSLRGQLKFPDSLRVLDFRLIRGVNLDDTPNGHAVCGHYEATREDGTPTGPIQFYTATGYGGVAWNKAAWGDMATKMCLDAGF